MRSPKSLTFLTLAVALCCGVFAQEPSAQAPPPSEPGVAAPSDPERQAERRRRRRAEREGQAERPSNREGRARRTAEGVVPTAPASAPGAPATPAPSTTPEAPAEAPTETPPAGSADAPAPAAPAETPAETPLAPAVPAANAPAAVVPAGQLPANTPVAVNGPAAVPPASPTPTEAQSGGQVSPARSGQGNGQGAGAVRVSPAAAPRRIISPAAAVAARPAPANAPRPTPEMMWRSVMAREPLGFSVNTPAHAYNDLAQALHVWTGSPGKALADVASLGLGFWVALAALGGAISGLLLAERLRPPRWRGFWLRIRRPASRSRLWQALVTVAQRTTPPLIVLSLWTVGSALAGADNDPAAVTVEWLLLIWLGYRVLDAALGQFAARLLPRPETAALRRAARPLLGFAAVWLSVWVLLAALATRDDVVRLWIAIGHVVIVFWLFTIVVRKDRVVALLPDSDSRGWKITRSIVNAVYLPLVYASLALALLWVLGYRNLADVVLGRSWAVIGICLMSTLLYRGIVLWLRQDRPGAPGSADTPADPVREEALRAGARLLGLITILVTLSLCLRALGLRQPLLEVLAERWVQLGPISLTGRAIWGTITITVMMLFLSRWLQAALAYRLYPRIGVGVGETYALNQLLHYSLLSLTVVLVLHAVGVSPASLAIVLGGLSVGIGFGLQDIAKNIAAGITLLVGRQVRKGDVVSIGDRMGTVQSVNLRSTVVATFDNVHLLIPNSKLLDDIVINWTHGGTQVRTQIPLTAAYGSDPNEVMEIALRVAREHPDVVDSHPPDIWLTDVNESALRFNLLIWTDMAKSARSRVVSQIYIKLLAEFEKAGIQTPSPTQDINLVGGPWKELTAALSDRPGKDGETERRGEGEIREQRQAAG